MCSTPSVPTAAVRQPTQLPDAGSSAGTADNSNMRRAILAGLTTSPWGVLGNPNVGKSSLG